MTVRHLELNTCKLIGWFYTVHIVHWCFVWLQLRDSPWSLVVTILLASEFWELNVLFFFCLLFINHEMWEYIYCESWRLTCPLWLWICQIRSIGGGLEAGIGVHSIKLTDNRCIKSNARRIKAQEPKPEPCTISQLSQTTDAQKCISTSSCPLPTCLTLSTPSWGLWSLWEMSRLWVD